MHVTERVRDSHGAGARLSRTGVSFSVDWDCSCFERNYGKLREIIITTTDLTDYTDDGLCAAEFRRISHNFFPKQEHLQRIFCF